MIRKKAFTTFELMLVLTLISISIGIAMVYSRLSLVRADLNAQTTEIMSALRLAQSQAAAGQGGVSHGVHLETGKYVIFEGSSYSEGTSGNLEKELPPTLNIQNISLNGGGSDIIFTPPYGETSTYGSLELSSSGSGQSHTITISNLGLVQY